MRLLWLLWCLLTWLSAMLTSAGSLLPYWLRGSLHLIPPASKTPAAAATTSIYSQRILSQPTTTTAKWNTLQSDLGLFRRCVYPLYSENGSIEIIMDCGHYDFTTLPHPYCQLALLLLCISCSLLYYLTFLLFFIGFCLYLLQLSPLLWCCQLTQLLSGILTVFACVLFLLSWDDNSEIIQLCGYRTDGSFSLGRCRMGGALILTLMGGGLAILTAILFLLMKTIHSPEGNAAINQDETTLSPPPPHPPPPPPPSSARASLVENADDNNESVSIHRIIHHRQHQSALSYRPTMSLNTLQCSSPSHSHSHSQYSQGTVQFG